jgi:ATF/CREB family transcription factor
LLIIFFGTAALKCRQRKKAWLAQLQAKVEFLSQENERLQAALVSAREEIARLSSAAASVLPQAHHHHGVNGAGGAGQVGGAGGGGGVGGGAAPVSVNVALPPPGTQKAVVAGGARGYGY